MAGDADDRSAAVLHAPQSVLVVHCESALHSASPHASGSRSEHSGSTHRPPRHSDSPGASPEPGAFPVIAGGPQSLIIAGNGGPDAVFSGTATFEPQAAIPEPGAWALMILGFGGAGAMLRRRRDQMALTAA